MKTKVLLTASAALTGTLGIIGLFMPHEVLMWVGIVPSQIPALLVQWLGALLFASAMMNWSARGSLIGGIYNRPLTLGNLTHFLIGALALAKGVVSGERQITVVVLTLVYVAFALAFIAVFFRSPVNRSA